MADQAALQEAIQRARQLAAKITQSTPVKRPAPTSDHSGPVKVTLAYEKPANTTQNKHHGDEERRRSSSRDHNRNERESRDSRPPRDYRDDSRERESRRDSNDRHMNHNSGSMLGGAGRGMDYPSDTVAPPMSRQGDEKIELIIPHDVIGLVIGKGGENIKRIQNESGATVRVDPNTVDEKGNKLCTITGAKQAVEQANIEVNNVIESARTGSKRPRLQSSVEGTDSYRMKIPASRTGAIIGKGGETIKSIKQNSGCDIELDKGAKECGPEESLFIIRGTQDKIMKAKSLIEARLAQGRGGGRGDGPRDHNHHNDHSSGRSGSKSFATGANAAPVAPYPDLPASYPAAGQQNSPDVSAAWAAYFAQYSTLFNQAGAQPAATAAPATIPYAGQSNLLGATPVSTSMPTGQQLPQLEQPQQPAVAAVDPSQGAQGQQDYSDQWIEYYLANGRPDYAEQIIQMKKSQQAQKQ